MAHESLTARTDAKIRYAKLHLTELRDCKLLGQGHDFERAHQEAFFAQIFGAYASLLQELNEDLDCGLKPESVSLGQMRNAMKTKGAVDPKLTELYNLEQDETTWFSQAKAMRDHTTHIGFIPQVFGQHVFVDVTSLMIEVQRLGLPDFQIRILEDLRAVSPGLIEINDTTGAFRGDLAPTLTITYF